MAYTCNGKCEKCGHNCHCDERRIKMDQLLARGQFLGVLLSKLLN